MNQKHKDFINKKLIPFILREQGRGFVMDTWLFGSLEPGEKYEFDSVERKIPVCGTVACIGGSTEFLRPKVEPHISLGLTELQADTLFHGWEGGDGISQGWPEKYIKLYSERKTPLGKAKVAVALLKEVVKTNGKILNGEADSE